MWNTITANQASICLRHRKLGCLSQLRVIVATVAEIGIMIGLVEMNVQDDLRATYLAALVPSSLGCSELVQRRFRDFLSNTLTEATE
jgi:hypothetical protein